MKSTPNVSGPFVYLYWCSSLGALQVVFMVGLGVCVAWLVVESLSLSSADAQRRRSPTRIPAAVDATGGEPQNAADAMAESDLNAISSDETAPEEEIYDGPPTVEVAEPWYPVNVGKDALRRHGALLPISVSLRSLTGKNEQVILEAVVVEKTMRQADDRKPVPPLTVRKVVEVSPGAPKRAWIMACAVPELSQYVTLRVRWNDSVIFSQDVGDADCVNMGGNTAFLSALVVGTQLMRVIPDQAWFQTPRSLESAFIPDTISPKSLPDNVTGYHPFDVVILRDFGDERLEPAQLRALRQWIFMGGYVILAPSTATAQLFHTEVAELLLGTLYREPVQSETPLIGKIVPVMRVGNRTPVSSSKMTTEPLIAKKGMAALEEATIALFDPVDAEGRREIVMQPPEEAGDGVRLSSLAPGERGDRDAATYDEEAAQEKAPRLYTEVRRGLGRLGVVMFNDHAYSGVEALSLLKPFWRELLGSPESSRFSANGAKLVQKDLAEALKDKSRDVGFPFIVALVIVYLALVGPGLYFVLRRMRRLTWLIWAQPLVVMLYLGVIFVAGYVSKGVVTKARQWTVLSHRQGDVMAMSENFLAVFSGDVADYTVGTVAGALLKPVFANQATAQRLVVEESPTGAREIQGLHLEQWQEGYVVSFDVADVASGGIDVVVLQDRETADLVAPEVNVEALRVKITNHLPYDVREGIFDRAGRKWRLPPVGAGGTVQTELSAFFEELDEADPLLPTGWEELRIRLGSAGFWQRPPTPTITALLDRDDLVFDAHWTASLRERHDIYLMYGQPR